MADPTERENLQGPAISAQATSHPTHVFISDASPDAAVARALLEALAALTRQTDFSVGCYLEKRSRWHRSLLKDLLRERGANVRGTRGDAR